MLPHNSRKLVNVAIESKMEKEANKKNEKKLAHKSTRAGSWN